MNRHRLAFWASLLSALPLWNACQSTKSEEQETSAVEKPVAERSPAAIQAEALAQRFGPILRGAWVNADYLAAVRRTRSPLQAFEVASPVSEILFDPARRTGDSLVTTLGIANHEGAPITVYFRPGQQPTSLPTSYRDYETPGSFAHLGYQASARDTTLQLTTYSKARKTLSRTNFQRVRGASLAELGAVQVAVNQLLFAGRYVGTDSLGRPVQMQFTDEGRVKGLRGFKTYHVTTDFGGGPGNEIDNIRLDPDARHSRPMGYSHRGDTLRLYAAAEVLPKPEPGVPSEELIPTMVRGRLLFTLVRR